ncbi:hypothetical protein SAMN05443575_0510 [Jatrophihabitans endophyticus]|uniref:WD40-like Beta Propeller Repeat n=1 Tax=Jatrophihabitans endophyticus TaxID=1206085 RepID=A0A1M5DAC7_9ACTN|nr:hypothetical protein [Jatrophihabitans endophyticus]SHF63948.1 hypothetical protein SAMN05443575_0510 [Jatrophihabitans endophyticus]
MTTTPTPAAATGGARALLRITDPRLDEVSGLAPGHRSPGVYYVQNDSGDENRFFGIDARTGATVATVHVAGATNVDWEDIATAGRGTAAAVWLADIGDNDAQRDEVRVYRVREPRLAADERDGDVTTARADVWRLRYPGGPVDAESLAVSPAGTAYVVTKSLTGTSTVYRVPARPSRERVRALTRVARVTFSFTGTPGGPNAFGQLTATGAAFSTDGRLFAVRTYTDAYVWRVGAGGDLAAALRATPTRVALPAQPQGEGIAIVGRRLLVDSEGTRQRVWSVPLPAAVVGTADSTPAPTSSPSRSPATRSPRTMAAGSSDGGSGDSDGDGDEVVRYLVGGALVIVLAGVVLAVTRRR